jgi:AbrB family looped-hinge helix DNA binding protein
VKTTKVSAKGQVVIPKELRDELGWGPGLELVAQLDGQKLVLQPSEEARREAVERFIARWGGALKGSYTMEEYMADKQAEIDYEDRPRFSGDR